MKELEENNIEQIRTLQNYLEQTDLLKKKDILRCLDVIVREYGGKVENEMTKISMLIEKYKFKKITIN